MHQYSICSKIGNDFLVIFCNCVIPFDPPVDTAIIIWVHGALTYSHYFSIWFCRVPPRPIYCRMCHWPYRCSMLMAIKCLVKWVLGDIHATTVVKHACTFIRPILYSRSSTILVSSQGLEWLMAKWWNVCGHAWGGMAEWLRRWGHLIALMCSQMCSFM